MAEQIACNTCELKYDDEGSIEMAKKWIADGYAPCPNIGCRGLLVVTTVKSEKGPDNG